MACLGGYFCRGYHKHASIMTRLLTLLASLLLTTLPGLAQEAFTPTVKIGGAAQVWLRLNHHNPGTADVNGITREYGTDAGIRRARLTVTARPAERVQTYIQIGANNLTNQRSSSGASPVFIHDAWASYELIPAGRGQVSLLAGGGLHYFNGLSRLSSGSYRSSVTLDLPGFHLPNISRTDQAGRQPGVFVSGTLSRFAYRFHLNRPYLFGDSTSITSRTRAQNLKSDHWSTGGHVAWEFLGREKQTSCYRNGTYLGKERILNLGAGFYHHAQASATLREDGTLARHDHLAWAVDLFTHLPIGTQGLAYTGYAGWFNFDYGPNYYRSGGTMNPGFPDGHEIRSLDGPGNAEPLVGTGQICYTEQALLLPALANGSRLQLFAAAHYKDLAYLDAPAWRYDGGVHLYPATGTWRTTFQYSSRPVESPEEGAHTTLTHRGQFVLQMQVYW